MLARLTKAHVWVTFQLLSILNGHMGNAHTKCSFIPWCGYYHKRAHATQGASFEAVWLRIHVCMYRGRYDFTSP